MRRRLAYSPLTKLLRSSYAAHAESERLGIPVDEVAPSPHDVTRRQVLAGGVGAGAALLLHARGANPATAPKVVIVGAGLAGLRCAHRLRYVYGIGADIFEGSDRIGGRCWTLRDYFAGGQTAEHGGELISSEHRELRALAADLGLELEVVYAGAAGGLPDVFSVDGAPYTLADANADWYAAYPAFSAAAEAAPYPQLWSSYTAAGRAIDQQSVPEWIDANVPGGTAGRFGKLLLTDTLAEFGGEPSDQSALNLLYLLAFNHRSSVEPLPGTDERYHILGGSDQVVTGLLGQLPSARVHTGSALVALRRLADGRPVCTFESGSNTFDVVADHVVLALPFATLRDLDLSGSGLSHRKRRAIVQLGMGTNSKLHVQVTDRPWVTAGLGGGAYSDPDDFQTTWDETAGRPEAMGIILDYLGGVRGAPTTGAAFGPAPPAEVAAFLSAIEPVFPGTSAAYDGLAWRDVWALDPWHKGAYSYWKPSQYTTIAGYERAPEGAVHFCGEHTSVSFQGYMEGAITSGMRAADEVAGRST